MHSAVNRKNLFRKTTNNHGKEEMKSHTMKATALLAMLGIGSAEAQLQGPSSSATAYVIPTHSGVTTRSIMTVGDSVNLKPDGVNPYRLVGIPDGLGAYDNG